MIFDFSSSKLHFLGFWTRWMCYLSFGIMLSYKEWIKKRSYFVVKAVDVIQLKAIIKHKQTQMVVHFLPNLDSRFLDNTHCDRTLIREQMQALHYF